MRVKGSSCRIANASACVRLDLRVTCFVFVMRSAWVIIKQLSGDGSLEKCFEVRRHSVVPGDTFFEFTWQSIALGVTVSAISLEDEELVVVDEVALHLGEESLERKELTPLPPDEGRNVKFLTKTLLTPFKSPLEDGFHAAAVTQLVAPVDSVASSEGLSYCDLLELPCILVFADLFLSFLNEKGLK